MPPDPALPLPDERTEGYVTEVGYTFDYHPRTNPQSMRLALLKAGLQPPDIEAACELGFGQGVSLALHAAAGSARWWGNDFNDEHLRHARALAAAAGVRVDLFDDSFADLGRRRDLPGFDYIVMHGIWSWISDRNRQAITDFVGQRLKPGGVLYVSYNALPGLAAFEPVRHLLTQHAARSNGRHGILERIDGALEFTDRLLAAGPAYVKDNPGTLKSIQDLKDSDRRYLAHEYFNRDWRPMHFAEVTSWLAPAGLVYAGPGGHRDAVEAVLIDPAQQALLETLEDPVLRETARDFLLNRSFRCDYWMKPPLTPAMPSAKGLCGVRIVAIAERLALPFEARAPLILEGRGPADATVTAVLDLLSDRRPRSLGDIATLLAGRATLAEIVDVAGLLLNYEVVGLAQSAAEVERARVASDMINAHLLEPRADGNEVLYLASPVLGGGIRVSRLEKLFLRALQQGQSTPEQWIRTAQREFATPAGGAEAPRSPEELARQAAAFADTRLPLLRALLVA